VLLLHSNGGVTGAGGASRGRKLVNMNRGLHVEEGGTSRYPGRHSHQWLCPFGVEQLFWCCGLHSKNNGSEYCEVCIDSRKMLHGQSNADSCSGVRVDTLLITSSCPRHCVAPITSYSDGIPLSLSDDLTALFRYDEAA
jgi:hypothetical protein